MKFNMNKEVNKLIKNRNKLERMSGELFDTEKLTTPSEIDSMVSDFCIKLNPNIEPYFLPINPEPWCRQSCCDLNVQKYIESNGGEMICGYKIWYNKPIYIEAERHAIWSNGTDVRDLTFSADGEQNILFIPDVPEKSRRLEDNLRKIRSAPTNVIRAFIKAYEILESQIPEEIMSNEECWEKMITYEDWLKGKRMQSIFYE